MSEQLLTLLRFSLLAVLYLFLFRVVRAVWAEISPPARAPRVAAAAAAATPAPAGAVADRRRRSRHRGPARPPGAAGPVPGAEPATGAPPPTRTTPRELVVVEPGDSAGARHPIPDEATIGRAGGCTITVADTFASSLHARLFRTPDGVFVEDLGSTNGTVLNGERVGGPRPLFGGDRVKVGNTVLEAR